MIIPGVPDIEAMAFPFNPPGGLSFSGIFCAALLYCEKIRSGIWGVFTLVSGPAAYSSTDPLQCKSEGPQEFSGKVAVIDRGVCNFADKICNAQLKGATAAIVINNQDGSSLTMGGSSLCVSCFGQLSRAFLIIGAGSAQFPFRR